MNESMYDAEVADEIELLRNMVARFMRECVVPAEDKLPHDAYAMPSAQLDILQAKARELGLWCVASPEEHGGGGLSLLAQVTVAEEAAKCRMGAYVPACGAFGIDPPSVIWLGTSEQIRKYGVEGIKRGKKCYVAISEEGGGSDPARTIRTRAERDGDHYVLNGSKLWITAAGDAEWGIVFARTGEAGKGGGISAFIVDAGTPGVTMREIGVIRSYETYEITFDNVRVPAENLLGPEGGGFAICQKWLVHARLPYSAGVIGVAQAALSLAIDWAKQRNVHKSLLADKQAVQWMIADSEIELRAARHLVHAAARKGDRGEDIKVDASICKLYSTETAGRVIDRVVQIMGGMGVAKELPVERWYRELRIKRIGEGPSEVHRMVVARDLLKG